MGKKENNEKPKGRKQSGVANFVRKKIEGNPKLTTQELRKLARKRFGYTYDIDRHFPQLVYRVRKQLGISVAS